jgi:hypothetical protein
MPDEHEGFRKGLDVVPGDGRVVHGVEAAGLADAGGWVEEFGERLGRLPGPELVGVADLGEWEAELAHMPGHALDLGPSPIGEGPLGVDLLGLRISVPDKIDKHLSPPGGAASGGDRWQHNHSCSISCINRMLKTLRSPFDALRANGGSPEILEVFPLC